MIVPGIADSFFFTDDADIAVVVQDTFIGKWAFGIIRDAVTELGGVPGGLDEVVSVFDLSDRCRFKEIMSGIFTVRDLDFKWFTF